MRFGKDYGSNNKTFSGGLCIDIGNGVECFGDAKNVAVSLQLLIDV